MALRVARLTLLVSLLTYGLVLLVGWLGGASEILFLLALLVSGWIALSALACVLIQIGGAIVSRRRRGVSDEA